VIQSCATSSGSRIVDRSVRPVTLNGKPRLENDGMSSGVSKASPEGSATDWLRGSSKTSTVIAREASIAGLVEPEFAAVGEVDRETLVKTIGPYAFLGRVDERRDKGHGSARVEIEKGLCRKHEWRAAIRIAAARVDSER
jgi:hypothetical protein